MLAVTGCNTVSINSIRYVDVPKYPRSEDPAQIPILHQWPDEPFQSLGEVTAQPNTDKVSAQKITTSLQDAAGKMGANAVVIVSDQNQVVGESVAGPWFAQMETPIIGQVIVGVAIRYKGTPPAGGPVIDAQALQWPRFYATNGYQFAVYQPQISSWPGNQLSGRFVVAARPAGTTNETYGIVFFNARTDVDKLNRLVTLEDFQITQMTFPTRPSMEDQYRTMLTASVEQSVKIIPLDHLEAILSVSSDMVKAKAQQVLNTPPQIFYATVPSLLVLVDGSPVLNNLTGNYQRVINTRNVLLFNTTLQNYYLFADNQWFSASALTGPWTVAAVPPSDISKALSAALATKQVDPLHPSGPDAPIVKQIFVSTGAAELLETSGSPNLQSIPGTGLLCVQNTSSAIFYYPSNSSYYVLISGRWFKASSLQGAWAFVSAGELPADFQKIPPDSDKSNVLMSVPGTPQAQEAVIANTIPQTATVQREQATLQVNYYGAPNFVPIEGTLLSYANNSQTPVIMVGQGDYYACQGGVWFLSRSPQGPWVAATSVPPAIYTIPTSCPIHYVTYAYVYSYTPSVVYVGYTPGYMGTVLTADGVVVYGTGYYYPPDIYGPYWVGWPPTYGYGASFAMGAAVGFSFGFCTTCCCQPYWGCYGWAGSYGYSYAHCNVNACNYYTHWGTSVHTSGSYGYNAFTGNQWATRSASTFNPYTGAHGYGSSGAAFNQYTGNAAAARSGSWYNPSSGRYAYGQTAAAGNAYNGSYARESSGSMGNVNNGNSLSWDNGNMSADKDGNLYSYNQASGAQKYNSSTGSWQSVDKSSGSFSGDGGGYSNDFDRESSGQSQGASRFDSWSHGGGGGWGGFHGFGGGGGGFSGFSGGGGFAHSFGGGGGFGGFRR
ncbi:MAG TPA: carbohydrate-binding family V/XII [Pseudomonadales bacterium]|nr:carbohydrate-binding family V/XII [Pseudomonadales bacterium]